MNEEKKRQLAGKEFTFEGHECTVAGIKNSHATITSGFPGFWSASWETVEKVAERDSNFTRQDVSLSSWRRLGLGAPLPQSLRTAY